MGRGRLEDGLPGGGDGGGGGGGTMNVSSSVWIRGAVGNSAAAALALTGSRLIGMPHPLHRMWCSRWQLDAVMPCHLIPLSPCARDPLQDKIKEIQQQLQIYPRRVRPEDCGRVSSIMARLTVRMTPSLGIGRYAGL